MLKHRPAFTLKLQVLTHGNGNITCLIQQLFPCLLTLVDNDVYHVSCVKRRNRKKIDYFSLMKDFVATVSSVTIN
jgi:hypothetical protein